MREDVEILALRHGETLWNRARRFQGVRDSPLTLKGIAQMKAWARCLRRRFKDRLQTYIPVASPLPRAWQSAVLLLEGLGIDPERLVLEPEVREISWGEWDGLTAEEIEARAPERWRRFLDRPMDDPPAHGGESPLMLLARARGWLRSLAPGSRILLVSHGTFIQALRSAYLDLPATALLHPTLPHDQAWHLQGGRAMVLGLSPDRASEPGLRAKVAFATPAEGLHERRDDRRWGGEAMARRVGDLVSSKACPVQVSPRTTVLEAARLLGERGASCLLVVEGERLVGLATARDLLLRTVAAGRDAARTRLCEVMTRDPDVVDARTPLADAMLRMDACGCRHLPVLRDGRVVGVLSAEDLPLDELLEAGEELLARRHLAERLW